MKRILILLQLLTLNTAFSTENPCDGDTPVLSSEWVSCSQYPSRWQTLDLRTGPNWRNEGSSDYEAVEAPTAEEAEAKLGTSYFTSKTLPRFFKELLQANGCYKCETLGDLQRSINMEWDSDDYRTSTIQDSYGQVLNVYSKYRSFHFGFTSDSVLTFFWLEKLDGYLPGFKGSPKKDSIKWDDNESVYFSDIYCHIDQQPTTRKIKGKKKQVREVRCSYADQK